MGTTERLIDAQNKNTEKIAGAIAPDKTLTKWTKIMAIAIIIQTITLIIISLIK